MNRQIRRSRRLIQMVRRLGRIRLRKAEALCAIRITVTGTGVRPGHRTRRIQAPITWDSDVPLMQIRFFNRKILILFLNIYTYLIVFIYFFIPRF